MIIDARGEDCPKPVMMAEEALSKTTEGIVEVIVDNEASLHESNVCAQRIPEL